MENTLQFDLNELVSNEIKIQIESLEKQIEALQKTNSGYLIEIDELKTKVKTSKLPIALVTHLKSQFEKIEADPRDINDYHKYKNEKQYLFIENIMSSLFGIKPENGGWLSSRGDGNLYHYLAVNFYSNKEILLSILPLLVDNQFSTKGISFIKDFIMPKDWSKKEVLDFAQNPGTCTNSSYMGVSNFWVERGAGKNNVPYNLVMMSPHFLNEDVFDEALNQMKKMYSNGSYFYSMYKYQQLTDDQINKMGIALVNNYEKIKSYEIIKQFINDNMGRFYKEILDFFYNYIDDNNEYRSLFWQKFPVEYQHKFLLSKSFDEVLKITTTYNCKWTSVEKLSFFKTYSNQDINQVS